MKNPEENRISEQYQYQKKWFKWGPYVSDRAWGTVREDYSADGDTWEYTTHDSARSKAEGAISDAKDYAENSFGDAKSKAKSTANDWNNSVQNA